MGRFNVRIREGRPHRGELRTYCPTVKGTDTSVVSHVIAIEPPLPSAFFAIANVSCSIGAASVRLRSSIPPEVRR
jgi:hypothetical protein